MTTRETINTGSVANDGTGDALRDAGGKINRNFGKIFNMLGPDSDTLSEKISFDSDSLIYNGTTNMTTVNFDEPNADRIATFPNDDGEVVLDSATQTLANKTLRGPTIQTTLGVDALLVDSDASAVNEVTVKNAATGAKPQINATGDDANISLSLNGKGTGNVRANKLSIGFEEITANGSASTLLGYSILNKGTALAVTLNNGTDSGETHFFTNKGVGTATITPTNFAQGTSFALPQNAAAQTMWDGDNWYLVGAFPDSDVTIT